MSSWVYLFSQFTPEALLFESLTITLLCAGYASFWVLRKRRMGAVDRAVPVGVVKTYLNALITDAEQLRIQLFGLLQSAGVALDPSQLAAVTGPRRDLDAMLNQASNGAPAAADGAKISALEAQMAQQAEAMQALMLEKARIEKELALARSATQAVAGAASASPDNSKALAELQNKIGTLEGKLAEYSVIEDDLANLKKLQQENAQLKAALGQGGATAAAAPAPTASAPAPAPVAAAPASAPAASTNVDAAAVLDSVAPESAFEGLVDQVEQSLQTAPAAPAPEATQEASPLESGGAEKTDADLVAEFEKMLNS